MMNLYTFLRRYFCVLTCLLLLPAIPARAGLKELLPTPSRVEALRCLPFSLGRAVQLEDSSGCVLLQRWLSEQATLKEKAAAVVKVNIDSELKLFDYALEGFPAEGYEMEVCENEITILAATSVGVIRATQTLMQLADTTTHIPACRISDAPAFKLRGVMHDVGRSFLSIEELRREIDLLSRFKINTFHWHLTENQAWRFEVKAYPQLTSSSSMTRYAGSYYTQKECRELEAYAAERGVVVIPEIDMPGHSEAFVRAMGHDMQTDQGVEELKTVLSEVVEAFPLAPYIHIGADEKTITYPDFLTIMASHVRGLGRRVVTWNPIRGATASSAFADMTQLWSTAGKAVTGLPAIDCRYNYVNHFDVYADLVGIYKSQIYYDDRGSSQVAGFITAIWNDRKLPTEDAIVRQNNLYANVIAMAERGWKGGGKQYIETGGTTLPNQGEEYDDFADWERRFLHHKSTTLAAVAHQIPYVRQSNVRWRITDAFPGTGTLPPETEGLQEQYTLNGTTYNTHLATGAGIYLRHTWGNTVPAFFANAQTGTTAYAWTYVYSPREQEAAAQIEFYNYGRSEKDAAPDRGKWDRMGSRIWWNDKELMPPTWTNSGRSITNETNLQNENFTARDSYPLTLQKGWNKVLLKLPFSPNGVRLQKWMFTFVLTDPTGQQALPDVVYSPDRIADEGANQLKIVLDDARQQRAGKVGTAIGYYPESYAEQLDSVIRICESTLDQSLPTEERAQQTTALQAALETFLERCAKGEVIQPRETTDDSTFVYQLCTPRRDMRYLSSQGANKNLTGLETPTDLSRWTFKRHRDGAWYILNATDKTYISTSASNNTALSASRARSTKGWSIKASADPGLVIISAGSVQINQCNAGLSYQIYNWGGGSNTTDDGCKYLIQPVEAFATAVEGFREGNPSATNGTCYDLGGRPVDHPFRSGVYVVDGRKILF